MIPRQRNVFYELIDEPEPQASISRDVPRPGVRALNVLN